MSRGAAGGQGSCLDEKSNPQDGMKLDGSKLNGWNCAEVNMPTMMIVEISDAGGL